MKLFKAVRLEVKGHICFDTSEYLCSTLLLLQIISFARWPVIRIFLIALVTCYINFSVITIIKCEIIYFNRTKNPLLGEINVL